MSSGSDAPAKGPMLLTYQQAHVKLGVSLSQLYRLMREGEIRPLKLSKQTRRISQAELDAYVKRLEAEQHGSRPAA